MGFDALDVAMKMVESLKPHLKRLAQRDRDLARQVKKAASRGTPW